jgi:hypothetical protein
MKYHFEHTILLENTKLNFLFSTQYLFPDTTYSVATLDENLRLLRFKMKQDEQGIWKIISPNPPKFLKDMEPCLADAIHNS